MSKRCLQTDIRDLDRNPALFREIFIFAWKMEFVCKYRNSIGQSIWTTLTASQAPGFVFSEKFESNLTPEQVVSIPI